MAGTVLVAVDPEAHADAVIDTAIDLASKLGSGLALLHVLPMSAAMSPDVLANPKAHPAAQKALREAEARVADDIRALGRRVRASGPTPTLHLAHGDAATGILEVAKTLPADFIVIGTHGRKGIARAALGSVAEAVIREATVPVVTVRMAPTPPGVPVGHVTLDLD